MSEQSINLYCTKGSSDKVYQIQIEKVDGGYMVNAQNGRRGSSLKFREKTAAPVTREKAQALFDKLVKSKLADHYTEHESGQAIQGTENAGRVSGLLPQLLNTITEAEAHALIRDPNWIAQYKADGERRPIQHKTREAIGINRKGLIVAMAENIAAAIKCVAEKASVKSFVIDTEDMGDHYIVFDLLELDGRDLRGLGAVERLQKLNALLSPAMRDERVDGRLCQVRTATTTEAKRKMFEEAYATGEEGMVFKRANAPYAGGRPASGGDALKYKFYAEATVRVACITDGKRSVNMEVMDKDGLWEPVGNITIPANKDVPKVGDLIEVRYLYAFRGGCLFQPQYKFPRTDLEEVACQESQLEYKGEARKKAA